MRLLGVEGETMYGNTPGEPAPAQYMTGGAQRSLGNSNLCPRGYMGTTAALSVAGKVLAGARQENTTEHPRQGFCHFS